MEKVFFGGKEFDVFDGVYAPAEDSFMLAKAVSRISGDRALDVGTGCGIIALTLTGGFREVIGTDMNREAVKNAKHNSEIIGAKNAKFEVSDMFGKVSGKFNLITFNPPYLPQEDGIEDSALFSGNNGREATDIFLKAFKNYLSEDGAILILQSSLSDYPRTIDYLKSLSMDVRIVSRERFDFEELVVIEARRR
jgi:release factor glutamine methyltransferase